MSLASEVHPIQGAAAAPLARLTAALDRYVCWVCVGLLAVIFVIMVLQVTCRYVLGSPLVWSEELARYLYIWVCFLGAPVALRRGNHIAITLFVDLLPRKLARAISVFWHLVAFLFLVELAIQGAILTARSHSLEAVAGGEAAGAFDFVDIGLGGDCQAGQLRNAGGLVRGGVEQVYP